MKKAGFFLRLIALLIDSVLFWAMGFVFRNGIFGVLYIVYETVLVSQWGGHTIGKKIMGIRVVPDSGGQVNWVKAFIRSISKILSAVVIYLGFLWMLWDEKSQTWHDKLAETYVIQD